ncbi:shikimate dehydrogenase family protein [Lapidilactobacillus gannanensis]|uniref:Shikimate dehydrogenase (NADP(+)) n=1 Tax=Lapidilactobacillus gannanensis TaxID=2486002 RepID=A0ABW4BQN0_9LACO|nr:shikimate dehydrogenase [Lapidilactobacillus gannanensis]
MPNNAEISSAPLPITGQTALYGLVAHPAHHSLSPMIHNYGFKVQQIAARYMAFDSQASAAEIATSIRALNIRGLNLSLPYKETMVPLMSELTANAQLIGAINTVKNDHGHLIGTNTDGLGLVAALTAAQVNLATQQVILLGGGATARAILLALVEAGCSQITVIQRANSQHYQQMQALLAQLQLPQVICQPWSALTNLAKTNVTLVVNATSIGFGQQQGHSPLTANWLSCLATSCQVWDVIYQPRQSALLTLAAARGLTTHNGLAMLCYQAAASFEFWTGQVFPVPPIYQLIKQK